MNHIYYYIIVILNIYQILIYKYYMKDTLKYGLIGFAITPIIILLIIYLVIFLFLSLDKKSTWSEDLIHAYEISYGLLD